MAQKILVTHKIINFPRGEYIFGEINTFIPVTFDIFL